MSKKNELPEFIIPLEVLIENRAKALKRDQEDQEEQKHANYEKRAFIVAAFIISIIATVAICQLCFIKETKETSAGTIECSGKLLQICTGPKGTENYMN